MAAENKYNKQKLNKRNKNRNETKLAHLTVATSSASAVDDH